MNRKTLINRYYSTNNTWKTSSYYWCRWMKLVPLTLLASSLFKWWMRTPSLGWKKINYTHANPRLGECYKRCLYLKIQRRRHVNPSRRWLVTMDLGSRRHELPLRWLTIDDGVEQHHKGNDAAAPIVRFFSMSQLISATQHLREPQ